MKKAPSSKEPSFIKPIGTAMQSEVRVIKLVLAGWFLSIVGFQIFAYLMEVNYSELLLQDLTFFNLPIQFWLTGQFLPLWFIILCLLFNLWMDRHTVQTSEGSLRFHVKAKSGEDE